MRAVSVYEAKTHLSRLLRRVRNGEQFVLSVSGRPVARLIPMEPTDGGRRLGGDEGLVWEADDFNAPLPPDVLAASIGC
jgi:prevent-host-death family protein